MKKDIFYGTNKRRLDYEVWIVKNGAPEYSSSHTTNTLALKEAEQLVRMGVAHACQIRTPYSVRGVTLERTSSHKRRLMINGRPV